MNDIGRNGSRIKFNLVTWMVVNPPLVGVAAEVVVGTNVSFMKESESQVWCIDST